MRNGQKIVRNAGTHRVWAFAARMCRWIRDGKHYTFLTPYERRRYDYYRAMLPL